MKTKKKVSVELTEEDILNIVKRYSNYGELDSSKQKNLSHYWMVEEQYDGALDGRSHTVVKGLVFEFEEETT